MSTSAANDSHQPVTARAVQVSDEDLRVSLSDGRELLVPLNWFPRLVNATPEQRSNWRFTGGGIGIHWEDLDEDLSVAGLLKGNRPR
ncbi:MAG: DUF2442 domain-containing protein [Myxococcaceae bacterium]